MPRNALMPLGLAGAALCVAGPAAAQTCAGPAAYVALGQPQAVAPGAVQRFAVDLADAEQVDIVIAGEAPSAPGDEPTIEVCDAAGAPLGLHPGPEGQEGATWRFMAPAAGRYTVVAAAQPRPRQLVVRPARAMVTDAPTLVLGQAAFARIARDAPKAWSFAGRAGQWVRLKVTSNTDTALHLVGPSPRGETAVLSESDDSEGHDPVIQRKLHVTGTYRVEVESLSDEPDDVTLDVRELPPPAAPPVPIVLRAGQRLTGTLENDAARVLYDLPVRADHAYRVTVTAPFDAAIDLGVANPVDPLDGALATGMIALRSEDESRDGTETLGFTAAMDGHVLLRVRGMRIDEGAGGFAVEVREVGD